LSLRLARRVEFAKTPGPEHHTGQSRRAFARRA
jgi:hypothetical protein